MPVKSSGIGHASDSDESGGLAMPSMSADTGHKLVAKVRRIQQGAINEGKMVIIYP